MGRYVIINAKKSPANIDVEDARIMKTEHAGHAVEMIHTICKEDPFAEIHIYGGDGSVFEAVNALINANSASTVSLYVHPFGTGNDFARNFSQDTYGKATKVDLIRFGDRYAANEINIGFDCDVVALTQKVKKSKVFKGSAAYLISAFLTLLKPMGKDFQISLINENGTYETINQKLLLCLVANGGYYGGGFHCAPCASLEDGLLEFLTVKKISRLKFLSFFWGYRKGRHLNQDGTLHPKYQKFLQYKRVKSVEFTDVGNICADGELFTYKNLSITVIPNALHIRVMSKAK